ncbi:MAG: flagellar hook-associated protein FlgK [Ignavibacteriales bacterium]|nr:flagellar hook-associated protein FlgK [Ignavibacteriales bacterium]
MGIGRLFDISVRAMATYQRAIDVASQNISNAGNTDYTRQRVVIATEQTQGGIGTGVKIQDVLRIRNDLLDSQIRKYKSSNSDANKRSELLSQIESVIAEPSDSGLSAYFNEFFNAWDQLTSNPNSTQLRTQIIEKASRLSERMDEVFDGFDSVESLLMQEASSKTVELNSYLKEINELNRKIYESEAAGIKASELKDDRDALIDKVSELANATVQINEKGAAVISIGGIHSADQNVYTEFEMKLVNGKLQLVSKNDPDAKAVLNSGELFAITDLYSNKISQYRTDLEKVAATFADKVNELHMTGYTLTSSGSTTGIPFFGELDGSGNVINTFTNGKLNINSAVLGDSSKIAASDTLNNDGNGNIANKIALLEGTKFSELNGQTILESYSSFLNNFGMEKTISDNKIESSELVLQQLDTQKSSYSGVSIDEEMTNIMKYQRSYEAAAKLIQVVDEMLQTIMDIM